MLQSVPRVFGIRFAPVRTSDMTITFIQVQHVPVCTGMKGSALWPHLRSVFAARVVEPGSYVKDMVKTIRMVSSISYL